MDREKARQQLRECLRDYVERVTEKSKSGLYVCPICGSGKGKNGTGAFSVDKSGEAWHCFSCNAGGDIFDLYGSIHGLTDYISQLKGLCDEYGITLDGSEGDCAVNHNHTETEQKQTASNAGEKSKAEDLTAYFRECVERLGKTDYFEKRGLSKKTIRKHLLGYDPCEPTLKGVAVIIPTGRGTYVARSIDPTSKPENRYRKHGSAQVYLRGNLVKSTQPIFITEGELDALSVEEAGGVAVALGSTANANKFLAMVAKQKPSQWLILALDNDDPGREATEELAEGLRKHNVPFVVANNPYGGYKDANEALMADRKTFVQAIGEAVNEAMLAENEAKKAQEEAEKNELEARKQAHRNTSALGYLGAFLDGIKDSVNTPCISTGFKALDNELDGGLYEGLYVVGGISSLGKTTLCLQIADQIAQAGRDVLLFSLEMARTEIMAKSISRHTVEICTEKRMNPGCAKTARGITTGKRYAHYSDDEKKLIQNAVNAYGAYAGNVYISEGVGDIGVDSIKHTLEEHIALTGKAPVVLVDYLQILAPYNDRATDKQNTDKAVMELKRISRDYKTPVIGISSFNRANYREAVTMEAFKESGAIEYSSDVLIGLQLEGAGKKDFDANEAKQKTPRRVELVILKNRNGKTGGKVRFDYYSMFNLFREVGK